MVEKKEQFIIWVRSSQIAVHIYNGILHYMASTTFIGYKSVVVNFYGLQNDFNNTCYIILHGWFQN